MHGLELPHVHNVANEYYTLLHVSLPRDFIRTFRADNVLRLDLLHTLKHFNCRQTQEGKEHGCG